MATDGRPRLVDRVHFAFAGSRVAVAAVLGILVFAVAWRLWPWQVATLVGWDAAAAVFIGWVFWMAQGLDSASTAMLASREDDSRAAADLLLVAASLASLAAVGLGLVKAAQVRGAAEAVITGLAVLTVGLSWAAVHTLFTLRYARLYYTERGGIDFNDDEKPDYHDFAYVALTIGMTYQVSDTDLTTKSIRRTVTRHAVLSYIFGTFVVAMMINVVAGLLR